LKSGIIPNEILESALIPAMANVGNRFSRHEIYVPQMLMSAKAMEWCYDTYKTLFLSG